MAMVGTTSVTTLCVRLFAGSLACESFIVAGLSGFPPTQPGSLSHFVFGEFFLAGWAVRGVLLVSTLLWSGIVPHRSWRNSMSMLFCSRPEPVGIVQL